MYGPQPGYRPDQDKTHNPGMRTDQESNWWAFCFAEWYPSNWATPVMVYCNIVMPQVKHNQVSRKKNVCVYTIAGEYKTTNAGSNGCVVLAKSTTQCCGQCSLWWLLKMINIFYIVLNKIKYNMAWFYMFSSMASKTTNFFRLVY